MVGNLETKDLNNDVTLVLSPSPKENIGISGFCRSHPLTKTTMTFNLRFPPEGYFILLFANSLSQLSDFNSIEYLELTFLAIYRAN